MQKNDHNECPFSDEILSYMYEEMPGAEQLDFEQHLAACQVCTDEFAAVSLARFETYDWKRVEFDVLQTPRIVIPYPGTIVTLGARISAWLSWVTVVPVAGAILVGLSVVYLFVLSGSKNPDRTVAGTATAEQPKATSIAPPIVDHVVPNTEIASKTLTGGPVAKPQPASFKRKPPTPRSQFAIRKAPSMRLGNDLAVNNVPLPDMRPAPRLGIRDEEDDRSLRLADLFDETNPPPQR